MDRLDFYFEQLVTQADMDQAFDNAETADYNLQLDNGYTGVAAGQVVAQEATPDLTVDITAGTAYDQSGQRVRIASTQNLDCSVDSNALPTTVVSGGNEKWLSVFVQFDRALSDPRVDGNGSPLQYVRSESFQFIVDQEAEASAGTAATLTSATGQTYNLTDGMTLLVVVDRTSTQTATFNTADFSNITLATAAEVAAVIQADINGVTAADVAGDVAITTEMTGTSAEVEVVGGTAASAFAFPVGPANGGGGPTRPALRGDAVLLADILLRNGTTAIYDAPGNGGATDGIIDLTTRREDMFVYTGSQFTIRAGTITAFADALASELETHINGLGSSSVHPGSAITFDNSSVPATWPTFAVATEVQMALDAVHADLASADATDGAAAVGYDNTGTTADVTTADVAAVLGELDSKKGSLAIANVWTGTQEFQDTVRVHDADHRVEADVDGSDRVINFRELQNHIGGPGGVDSDAAKVQEFSYFHDVAASSNGTIDLVALDASTTYTIEVLMSAIVSDASTLTGATRKSTVTVQRDAGTGSSIAEALIDNTAFNASAVTQALLATSGILQYNWSGGAAQDYSFSIYIRMTKIANQLI
jgi:hypothetical protein